MINNNYLYSLTFVILIVIIDIMITIIFKGITISGIILLFILFLLLWKVYSKL